MARMSLLSGGRRIVAQEGPAALLTGFGPTAVGYLVQVHRRSLIQDRPHSSHCIVRAEPSLPVTNSGRNNSFKLRATRSPQSNTELRYTLEHLVWQSMLLLTSTRNMAHPPQVLCRHSADTTGSNAYPPRISASLRYRSDDRFCAPCSRRGRLGPLCGLPTYPVQVRHASPLDRW